MNFAISYKCPIGLACVTMQMNFIIFFALGKNYNTCGKMLSHLRKLFLLHLREEIITLAGIITLVGRHYYTCGWLLQIFRLLHLWV